MADWLNSIILGVVEGVTEFLPISSTGHLIVASDLLKPAWEKTYMDTFNVVIQGGAILAVIVYYWRDLLNQARAIRTERATQRLWLGILLAFIPAGILGFLLGDKIQQVLFRPSVVAWALIVGGVLMYVIELLPRRPRTHELGEVRLSQAFLTGIAQILALVWPGFSRSASTILGGLLVGMDRPTATKFSFYLSIPVLGLASLYDAFKQRDVILHGGSGGVVSLLIGFVVSFVVAYFAIGWLLRFVSSHDFKGFAVYRVIVGVLILVLAATGVIQSTQG